MGGGNPVAGRAWASILVLGPLAVSMCVPFFGPLLSFLPPLAAFWLGPRLWPGVRPSRAILAAVAASAAVWIPTALVMTGSLKVARFAWLLLPLCGPIDAQGKYGPAIPALAVYALAAFLSVRLRRPWVWVVGSWAGVALAAVTSRALELAGHGWGC